TVEFIHTATLLHDDVVDESNQRRGRPTANLLWDNQSSVLVGDYLFSRAFQLMVETQNLDVLDILANASAVIAEGEVLQLSVSRNLTTSQDTYLQVIRGKTAALFAAACKAGAVIADANEDMVRALNNYGDALGISFQMIDDLLDYTGEAKSLGKNVGDDFRERKLTLPLIKAIEKADDKERQFWTRVIEKGDQEDGDLDHALEIFAHHGSLEETKSEAEFWVACAQSALEDLPASETRDILGDLLDYILSRTV
ncbi:MAG: polyprenyl synthetase family protein, partial [Pseudomonadota bacterium]